MKRRVTVSGFRFPEWHMPGLVLVSMLVLAFGGVMGSAFGSAIEPYEFASEVEETRFRALAEELRCTVCQNQSLADSDAPLAQDLRRELYGMIRAGQSDMEIRNFMVERYGDFVLYRPPMAGHTLLLWAGPPLILIASLIGVVLIIQRRRKTL